MSNPNLDKIAGIADRGDAKLLIVEDINPFSLHKNTIIVGRNKVSYIREIRLIKEKQVVSINVEDILNVEVNVNVLMGEVSIVSRYYAKEPLRINSISRKDALKVKRVIQGLLVCADKKIDITQITNEELLPLLIRLGTA